MRTITKIELQHLPAIYPVEIDFIEQFNFDERVYRVGCHSKDFIAKDPVTNSEVVIQNVLYERYESKFFVSENAQIENIKFAGIVTVTWDDGTVHHAKVLKLDSEFLGVTFQRRITLQYYDLASEKVSNFMVQDRTYLSYYYGDDSITELQFTFNSVIYSLLTILNPIFTHNEPDVVKIKTVNREIISQYAVNDCVIAEFYVDGTTAKNVGKYLQVASNVKLIHKTIEYPAVEFVKPEIAQKEGADLWLVKIKLSYGEDIIVNPL